MKAPDELRDFDTVADFAAVAGRPMNVIPTPELGVAVVAGAEVAQIVPRAGGFLMVDDGEAAEAFPVNCSVAFEKRDISGGSR